MRLLAVAAAVAAAGGALANGCAARQARPEMPGKIEIHAAAVGIEPDELHGLRLRGAVALASDSAAFGGISGLLIDGHRLIALSDHGWLIESPLIDDAEGLRPAGGDAFPLRDGAGRLPGPGGRDAEGLARTGDGLAVSFERDHRVEFLDGDRPRHTVRDRGFRKLGNNKGLEALATLPDGRLIAISEQAKRDGFPVYVLDADGVIAMGALPDVGDRPVTGADVGPDGRLYLLRRDFSFLTGFSIRIERYRLGPDGMPLPQTREKLAAFDSGSGIDNMEAIAVWRDAAGATRLAIASDDNFHFLQRNLLIDFEVLD